MTNGIKYPNIRAEMGRSGLTIGALAGLVGMDRNRLSRKLAGKTPISLEEAYQLREALKAAMPLDWLFAEEVAMDSVLQREAERFLR